MKKRKILALVLACATILSLVGCGGNTATTNETEKDTTISESENTETAVDLDAWETMTVSIDGVDVTMGESPSTPRKEQTTVFDDETSITSNVEMFQIVDMTDLTPNNNGWGRENIRLRNINPDANIATTFYPTKVHNVSVYFPTANTDIRETYMFAYDVAFALEDIYAANNGEVELPEIILPNGLKVGQYLQNGCPEIIAAYGEPDEINQTTAEYGNGEEYVYISDDGTKKFAVYATSSQLVGFRMWIDYTTQEWYNPASENNYYHDNY